MLGVQIKKGDLITASALLSTRDPDEFENPHDVIFERSPNRHNAFSFGPHRCLGSHLARLEVTIALEEWMDRVPPFSLKPDSEIEILGGGVMGIEALNVQW